MALFGFRNFVRKLFAIGKKRDMTVPPPRTTKHPRVVPGLEDGTVSVPVLRRGVPAVRGRGGGTLHRRLRRGRLAPAEPGEAAMLEDEEEEDGDRCPAWLREEREREGGLRRVIVSFSHANCNCKCTLEEMSIRNRGPTPQQSAPIAMLSSLTAYHVDRLYRYFLSIAEPVLDYPHPYPHLPRVKSAYQTDTITTSTTSTMFSRARAWLRRTILQGPRVERPPAFVPPPPFQVRRGAAVDLETLAAIAPATLLRPVQIGNNESHGVMGIRIEIHLVDRFVG
ncbi:hypothetical protein K491DRAFT_677599 [Lophiostoma macrostomum CBS 122681]|uniref:Uncharacterized protein n=1 Tax=Lophiostoma macrostomum CBS 122681 TaxID=1314788 RepID=A0A6A6TAG7_9PLEO|nr:hypothetical protein K491DRAFT_677599 [Lophiostoma macrostomum CBS 122681]